MSRLGLLLTALFVLQISSAYINEEGEEYCEGKGSICQAFDDLDRECGEDSGLDRLECICESGWVNVYEACEECKSAMGETYYTYGAFYTSSCKEYSFTVGAVPSSILASQSQRNKTVEIPTVTLTTSSTYSFSYETPTATRTTREPYSTTIFGMTPVTLPPMASATEEPSIGPRVMSQPLLAMAFFGLLIVLV